MKCFNLSRNCRDFKDSIITVLCYYYRNVKGMNWDEIKEILGMPDINTIKQGIRASQYESYIKELIDKRIK